MSRVFGRATGRWPPWLLWGLAALVVLVLAAGIVTIARSTDAGGSAPPAEDYVDIADVSPNYRAPEPGPDASAGSATSSCGLSDHRNADNMITAPGERGAAHHLHEYVGNTTTDAFSTDQSLAAADTSCDNGDRSTYFWPVLRVLDDGGEHEGNHGSIQPPASVRLEFRGNPVSAVVAMPRFLRASTGDARAVTRGAAAAGRPQWTCSGATDRRTTRYPHCPDGQRLLRIFDFPSCWDGRRTDSPNHRSHIVFAAGNGACPRGFFPVPQLHMEIAYERPPEGRFAIDSFPEERRSPLTDHADFVNVMSDELMARVVDCVNSGRSC
jgi:Domain of unknown function (DUF1996)